ncbi:DUF6068 family protein [Pyxidicoccus xibeiensis]|uniref:DUF6068 family protein n=1 Tax=Pyxidicoccus xibeiensis TaxID=2906759 RepID=UPI0020A825B7|nr:DUF6068 family protein [Pyxidicoccus xibeiensis]MCP3136180.1 DUF6068 family protein [Pyxidicoccus xibeiensis]
MQKPRSFLSRSALLCTALALVGTGCRTMAPDTASPSDGTPVGQDTGTGATPPEGSGAGSGSGSGSMTDPGTAVRGDSPWQRARVGDRVTYSFSANRSTRIQRGSGARAAAPEAGDTVAVAGVVTLEVVAVESPWVWLSLSFAGDGGAPLTHPRLSRSLVLPVRSYESRPLEVPREGVESTEQPTAAGRTWEAKRYMHDQRPVDGPLQNRLYAVEPGPLYLTNGLLDASTTLSGFGASGGYQLTLMEVRRGTGDNATAAVPALTQPMGPGTWYDVKVDSEGSTSVQRTCIGAERGYVLRQQATPTRDGPACPDFAQADVMPLEEAVLSLAWEAVGQQQWPPQPEGAAPAKRETLEADEHKVAVLVLDTPDTVSGAKAVRAQAYAADPWDASLAGLAHEARFQTLADTVYRLAPRGKRTPSGESRVVDWGTWAAKP